MSAAGFSKRLHSSPPFISALLQEMLRKANSNFVEASVEGWLMPWLSSGESRTSHDRCASVITVANRCGGMIQD